MPIKKQKYHFPLHIHIGALFIILIIAVGSALAWTSYKQITRLTFEATETLFTHTAKELQLQFQKEYRPIATSVRLLASAAITETSSLQERIKYMPILAEVIREEPQVTGFQLGYDNGDYFILRSLNTDYKRKIFAAPDYASYMIDHISHNESGDNVQLRLFLNEQLKIKGEIEQSTSPYDPRNRPWYTNAEGVTGNHITSPYLFFFEKKIGITLSRKALEGNSIVAADITLGSLTKTLDINRISPSSISLIYNQKEEILAHSLGNNSSLLQNNSDQQIPTLSALSDTMIDNVHFLEQQQSQVISFMRADQRWFGTVRDISLHQQLQVKLLVAAPEKELLAAAFEMRKTSLLVTIAVVLLSLPIAWISANKISRPMRLLAREAKAISGFNFEEDFNTTSSVQEVDQLGSSMDLMRVTISNFLNLITSLSGESNIERLLERVTDETMKASGADAAVIYLLSDDETQLEAQAPRLANGQVLEEHDLPAQSVLENENNNPLLEKYLLKEVGIETIEKSQPNTTYLLPIFKALKAEQITVILLPLSNRDNDSTGALCLIYAEHNKGLEDALKPERIGFAQALSGFAAVSMESRQLIKMQKTLLQSFIELIASAIDAKSPYTGGHCQRVPEITKMLARAACDSHDPRFEDFSLNDDQWEELHIAAWLHDCGKMTTPEYVVDKSTKLETIYDRIHEIRMRFEVLKRDAELDYWQQLSNGGDQQALASELNDTLNKLDDDFAFVAECNEGGEFMAPEKIDRINQIAERTWRRTLSDRLGISWEENQRKQRTPAPSLPTQEPLLADKEDQIFYRQAGDVIPDDNPWGFKIDTPAYTYNRGELYNLSISRGTLAEEERFKINDHMVQTIIMLNQLPYPKHLRNVPAIAGGHHETMIGTGYPKRLRKEDMPLTARMMAIADIFEALTAADRPYKKAKPLSESIRIMAKMRDNQHIDADLFDLFLQSGVYLDYAKQFLAAEQIDAVDISQHLSA